MKSATLKICIMSGILALAGTFCFFILFYMTKAEVTHTSMIQDEINKEVTYADQNHVLSILVTSITPDMDKLSSHLVASDGTVSFIEKTEDLAKQAGLSVVVKSISTSDATPKEYFQWLQISLTTEGSFADQYKFLSLLENWPYKLTIGNILLNQVGIPDTTGSGSSQHSVNKKVWDGTITFNVLQEK